jgi:pimeloyl-ACP methyl ester carboxylesterase
VRNFDDRSTQHWAFLKRADPITPTDPANTKLAVFVHGFRGGYLSTWGALPDLLYRNADTDHCYRAWDYVFLGYSTWDIKTYLDIADLIATEVRQALKGEKPYGHPYKEISLLGHSLGTLGIRQFLCSWSLREPPLVAAVKSVTLFGSPGEGSPLARIAAPVYSVASALKPKSPQLRMLKEWTSGAHTVNGWPPPRLVIGKKDWVVGKEACTFAGDGEEVFKDLGHLALVEPNSWGNSTVFDQLSKALT